MTTKCSLWKKKRRSSSRLRGSSTTSTVATQPNSNATSLQPGAATPLWPHAEMNKNNFSLARRVCRVFLVFLRSAVIRLLAAPDPTKIHHSPNNQSKTSLRKPKTSIAHQPPNPFQKKLKRRPSHPLQSTKVLFPLQSWFLMLSRLRRFSPKN